MFRTCTWGSRSPWLRTALAAALAALLGGACELEGVGPPTSDEPVVDSAQRECFGRGLRLLEPIEGEVVEHPFPLFRWFPRSPALLQLCQDAACATVLHAMAARRGAAMLDDCLAEGDYFWRAKRWFPPWFPWTASESFTIDLSGDEADGFRSPLGGGLVTWEDGRWTAITLDDGRVLALDEAGTPEIFDPACETFAPTGTMITARRRFRATKLLDGRVLVTGGRDLGNALQNTTEIFDPVTETFAAGPSMGEGRETHSATLLTDGRVLVVGDETAEIFDPGTSTFSPTTAPIETRNDHAAVRLADGRVLIAGGLHPGSAGGGARGDAEIFNPSTETYTVTGSIVSGRASHRLTLLPDGTVLVTGGHTSGVLISEVELFAPVNDSFTVVGSLADGRGSHTATLLEDGRVLLAGGVIGPLPADFEVIDGAMLYDPSTITLAPTAEPLAAARWRHGAARLHSGRVLIVGGTASSSIVPSAEIFVPADGP